MEFEKVVRIDDAETGSIVLSVAVSKKTVTDQLREFYSVVAACNGKDASASWGEIDDAAVQITPLERYRETRRDFVINRIASEVLASLEIEPALTPNVHTTEYPDPSEDYSFELCVVEKPSLALSSYDPVEIVAEDVEVTDDLVDGRLSMLLEARAEFEQINDHPVVLGDCISVDIATMCDGKTVPHLTGKKMIFELSDGSMPDGFVSQLLGARVGETRTIDYSVKRPRSITDGEVDWYTATVTVLEQLRKSVPALTDDWVNANIDNASSVAEFRAGVAQNLSVEVAHINRDTHARLANIELEKRLQGKIPDAFYQAARNGLMDKLERELAEKGQTLDDYYEQEHMNEEELSVQMLIKSGENLRQGFALEALFDGRGMQLGDADLRLACEQAFGEGTYDVETLCRSGRYRLVESSAKRMVALNWLADTVVVKGDR